MDALDAYKKRFGDIDTYSLGNVLGPVEILERCQRALDEDKPIDITAEYGLAPAPEDADL